MLLTDLERPDLLGLTSTPISAACGTGSRTNPRRLPSRPWSTRRTPVTMAPGWLRLTTSALSTGSEPVTNTIGIGLGRERSGRSERGDHRCVAANKIRGHRGKPIELAFGPEILDRDIEPLGRADLAQASLEIDYPGRKHVARSSIQELDQWHRRLLTAHGRRQCHHTAHKRYELPAPHPMGPHRSSGEAENISGANAYCLRHRGKCCIAIPQEA
jgi:hypothetical protein